MTDAMQSIAAPAGSQVLKMYRSALLLPQLFTSTCWQPYVQLILHQAAMQVDRSTASALLELALTSHY